MADAILVSLTKAVDTAMKAATWEIGEPDIDWDFEGRIADFQPDEGKVYLRSIVPKKFDQINRESRTELGYVATVDVDVRSALGVSQQGNDQAITRDELTRLIRFAEQVHTYFQATLSEARLTLADHGLIAEWIDEREGVTKKSELLVSYSPKFLRENRQFYAVCREVFELTPGTA
jgi:hypothetical protein